MPTDERGSDGTSPSPKATVVVAESTAELVIAAPPLNLFDRHLVSDLEQAVAHISQRIDAGEVRAVLVRAEGDVFCAGVDVHEFEGLSTAAGSQLMGRFLCVVQSLEALPVPTLAVVHALTLTIGFELTLGCDLIWAAEDAQLGLVEATVGLTPGGGGTQRLVGRAGVGRAAEIVMTGDLFAAPELQAWGIVNRVRPRETLLADARRYVAKLAAGPTRATGVGKHLLHVARDHGVAAADAVTPHATGQVFATRDLPAGIASLLRDGPRKATFEGR